MKEEKNSLIWDAVRRILGTLTHNKEKKRKKKGNALEVKGGEKKAECIKKKEGGGPAIVDEGSYDRTG